MKNRNVNRWAFEQFERQYRELLRLKKTASSKNLKTIDDTIDILYELIYEVSDISSEPLNSRIFSEIMSLKKIRPFLPFTRKFSQDIDFYIRDRYVYFPKISDDDLFAIIYDFYKETLDKDMFRVVKGMIKRYDRYVHMDRLMDNNFCPFAVFLPYYRKTHIFLDRKKTVFDISNMAHEYGHVLQYLINFDPVYLSDDMFFAEIVSTFFELLSLDYLKQYGEFSSASRRRQADIYMEYCDYSNLIGVDYLLLSHWKNLRGRERQKVKELETILEDYLRTRGLISYDLEGLLNLDLPASFAYVLSYLFAIELFEFYKKDRDYALFLLKCLIDLDLSMSNEEYFKNLLGLGLKPEENLNQYKKHILEPKSVIF